MSSEVETSRDANYEVTQRDSSVRAGLAHPLGMTKMLFGALDVYHDISSRSAATNMAIDEALLESVRIPSLRLYRWDHPALSFGYFGRFTDVANYPSTRDCVRRWTGGGMVFHGEDLTYSLVIPAHAPLFAESSIAIYEKIHRAIQSVLVASGEPAELAAVAADGSAPRTYDRRKQIDPAVADRRYNKASCFANAVRADVLSNGQKIAGAAQRRTRRGLLQQGSIQHIDLPRDFAGRFARELSSKVIARELNEGILKRAVEIAAEKYGTPTWLRKR